jgi:hypothetical protein
VVNRFPKRVLGLSVVNCQDQLRVHDLTAVYIGRSVVSVVRAPHAGAIVFNVVGNLDDQVGIIGRSNDFVLTPRLHL